MGFGLLQSKRPVAGGEKRLDATGRERKRARRFENASVPLRERAAQPVPRKFGCVVPAGRRWE